MWAMGWGRWRWALHEGVGCIRGGYWGMGFDGKGEDVFWTCMIDVRFEE